MKKTDFILIGIVLVIAVVAIFSSKGTMAQPEIDFPLELKNVRFRFMYFYSITMLFVQKNCNAATN